MEEKEVFWSVRIDVNNEEDAHKVFYYIDKHIDETGCKAAEYYIQSATTVTEFDEGEL